ncbi:M56 family metallopeptidase [Amycolatopsis silviterrae]|uniref:M56 family metallopeptidase n=1 Tax=Amycolatopsis silviterrae TaxID=1656914 RepID=A0ABW5HBC0_9PSEU
MIVSAALVATVAVVGFCGPALLRRALRARMPGPLRFGAWILLLGSMIAAGAGAVATAFGPGHEAARHLVARLRIDALRHQEVLHLDEVLGVSGALFVAGAAGAFAVASVRLYRHQLRLRDRHFAELSIVCQASRAGVWWLPLEEKLAYSIAGKPDLVVLSEGLAKDLSAPELAAVVDHERSHLRGRHHRLVGFAHAVSAALPFVPLARQSPEFVAAAVELSADAAAGRRHGPATVGAALDRMHPVRSKAVALRLGHLASSGRRHKSALRVRDSVLVLLASAVLPLGTAAALVVAGAWTATPALLHA